MLGVYQSCFWILCRILLKFGFFSLINIRQLRMCLKLMGSGSLALGSEDGSLLIALFCILQLSGVAPPPVCKNVQPNGPNPNAVSVDGSPRSTVNSTIQAPRRKFVDEGKLRKVVSLIF